MNQEIDQPAPQLTSSPQHDPTLQTLMPTKNKDSLISYYLGFASFLPLVGVFAAIGALTYSSRAMQKYNANPTPGAKGHAMTGRWLAIFTLPFHLLGLLHITTLILTLLIVA